MMYIKHFQKQYGVFLTNYFCKDIFFRSQCDFLKVVVPLWQSSFVLEKLIFHIALKTQKKKLFLHMYVSLNKNREIFLLNMHVWVGFTCFICFEWVFPLRDLTLDSDVLDLWACH